MGRRPELFVRELSDGEAEHLLRLARRSRSPVVQHRAMLLFASFQGPTKPSPGSTIRRHGQVMPSSSLMAIVTGQRWWGHTVREVSVLKLTSL